MSIKFKLKGFEDLLDEIQKANGSIDKAVGQATKECAEIINNELKSQMSKANVDSELINKMPPPQISKEGNRFTAKIGYKKGNYNPNDPSDAYKVIFLNYGTPNRSKHGKIVGKGFIQKAKKKSNSQVKKKQKEIYESILEGLKNETETN